MTLQGAVNKTVALLALVVLRHGLREGLTVAAVAALAFGVADLLLAGNAMRLVALLAVNWLPVIVLAAAFCMCGFGAMRFDQAALSSIAASLAGKQAPGAKIRQ